MSDDRSTKLRARIDEILASGEGSDSEPARSERIEALIETFDWPAVQACLHDLLRDDAQTEDVWTVAAEVVWGAASDGLPVKTAPTIALLYHRLPPDPGSNENNLAWSIASKLLGVGYLSKLDPLTDPAVATEWAKLRAGSGR